MVPMYVRYSSILRCKAEVKWNEEERTVTATDRSGKTIVFRIGENNYRVKTGLNEELNTGCCAGH